MNVLDAAYLTGQDYPGGTEALAMRVGRPNLSDELNPGRPKAKLGLQTAVDMQVFSGDFRVLMAMAVTLRHYPPVPMPDEVDGQAGPCMRTLAKVAQDFSSLMGEVTKDLADGQVSDNELKRVERAWLKLMQTGQHLLRELGGMNAATHTGHAKRGAP